VLLNEINRHKRFVMVIIFVFIGVPMTLVFIPGQVSIADFFRGESANGPVAMVGKTPVTAQEFINVYSRIQDQRTRSGQDATARDMVADGTVTAIMENLVQGALITEKTRTQPIRPDQKYLEERLRDEQIFKNEKGEFDAGAYNLWVKNNASGGANWDAIYASIAEGVNQESYVKLIGAATRVPESELRQQFLYQNTKMKVKAATVAPKVERSDEQLRAYYDGHLTDFMTLESRIAQFVSISLEAPMPPLVQELLDKAKAGEDFAELAKKNSQGVDAEVGGDMDWITDSPAIRDHEKVLFEMQPGEVRGPVESFFGVHIFKVEETRQNDAGAREVHARQILIRRELSEEERKAREARAAALVAKAAEAKLDLTGLAAAEGLELKKTDRFDNSSQKIEGIDEADAQPFRAEVLALQMGQVSGVIVGMRNLYLAEVVEVTAPVQRSFDDALEDVRDAAIRDHKQTPEYQQLVNDYVGKILTQAKNMDEMKAKFPELEVDIKTTEPFGMSDMLFNQGILMDGRTLLVRIAAKKPGEFVGPIYDLLRVPNFVEVVEKTLPEGDTWEEQYKAEKAKLREELVRMRQQQLQADYLQHLQTQFIKDSLIQKDDELVMQILGLDAASAAPAPSAEATAAAPSAEPAAATEVATPVLVTETPAAAAPDAAAEAPAPDTAQPDAAAKP